MPGAGSTRTDEPRVAPRWRFAPDPSPADTAAAAELTRALRIDPLLARLLVARGHRDEAAARSFLHPSLKELHDPSLLPGARRAAERIVRAVREKQPIVIYGDYDVDGITASAILWHTLREAGADVSTYVPHRIEEGYGLNCDAIRSIIAGATAKPLIVSVDCGITASDPARAAKDAGVDLIITDHHHFDAANLPDAYELVHPGIGNSESPDPKPEIRYPFPDLCGAGVAFKLAWEIARQWCGSERLPVPFRDLLLDLLSFAALGTIADVVPLVGENRVIAVFGLGQIERTRFAGLNALIDAAALRNETVDSYHVGFVLGPRLNACGRMGHAREAVHLLTAAPPDEAKQIAEKLTQENDKRRATERQIYHEACALVVGLGYDQPDVRAIVLGKEGWHQGVVGIVAARLVDTYSRPVVLLAYHGDEAHGSARSVDGVSIHDAFAACSEHLLSFGGHAMAAGLRLRVEHIDAFRRSLVQCINAMMCEEDLVDEVDIEVVCELADVRVDTFDHIRRLQPFGRGNPTPVFAVMGASLASPAMRMGAQGQHLRLTFRDGDHYAQAVYWGQGDLAEELIAGTRFDIAFEPQINEWQGQRKPQMVVQGLRPSPLPAR